MYRFKLEALLNHRRHQVEVCQKELAQIERHLADEQGKLHQQKREMRGNLQKLQVIQKESINVSDIILSVNYIRQLSIYIENQKKCVHQVSKKINQKRNELFIILKKRKALEKLKEKGRLACQQKNLQNERKLMDEVASTRHSRKM